MCCFVHNPLFLKPRSHSSKQLQRQSNRTAGLTPPTQILSVDQRKNAELEITRETPDEGVGWVLDQSQRAVHFLQLCIVC